MDLRFTIKTGFELFVKTKFPNRDIQNFLLKHERRELFVNNLNEQLYKSFNVVKNAKTFKDMVNDCSAMFCKAALDKKALELGHKPS
jgi:plasmid maintenance system killer protein